MLARRPLAIGCFGDFLSRCSASHENAVLRYHYAGGKVEVVRLEKLWFPKVADSGIRLRISQNGGLWVGGWVEC